MSSISKSDLLKALPDVESKQMLCGLNDSVTILRDQWGIPHIRATNESDVFFGQGFSTAQDRLWHMDYDRHRALGRWSEMAGAHGLSQDKLMRTFGVERAAKMDLEICNSKARNMVEAYTAGVNAFIESTQTLPIEYSLLDRGCDPWEPWHCFAVYKVRNMLMGTYDVKLWRARLAHVLGIEKASPLFRGYPDNSLVSTPPGELYGDTLLDPTRSLSMGLDELQWIGDVDGGSNAWAISGEKTESGLPLVAGDSHRFLDTPNVYYQTHINCPEFICSGYALPGVPGMPHFSHNDYVAWGMTHGFGDYQDLFIEKFRLHEQKLEYLFQDQWIEAKISTERLSVKDSEPTYLEVVRTQHGPVIAGDPQNGFGICFSHTGTNSGTPWMDTVHALLHSKNADETELALKDWTEPVNNFVYADVNGDFGYRYRGRIPIRNSANAWAPVPGWTGEHEWRGEIPFEELPHIRNPKNGFVVTCNNAPTTADYPHYINTYFAPDWRAQRINADLENIELHSAKTNTMSDVHADCISIPAQIFVEKTKEIMSSDSLIKQACEKLQQWDYRMDRESTAALIYSAARSSFYKLIIHDQLGNLASEALAPRGTFGRGAATHTGQLLAQAFNSMTKNDISMLNGDYDWIELVKSALTEAVYELKEQFGSSINEWQWGRVHHTRPVHPLSHSFPNYADLLDPPSIETHGDSDTPLAGGYAIGNNYVHTLMSVNRYIHDPSDWKKSQWIVPLGVSGHPGSPHYADQSKLWADIKTTNQLWDWKDIETGAVTRQVLKPKT